MLCAATAVWLMVIVLCAWAVYESWCAMVKPRIVNMLLLPGTLAAQMGHVLGLLVTGATVNNTSLIKDDETAAPQQTPDAKPRIPIIGPVVIGLFPLIMCAIAIVASARLIGGPVVESLTHSRVTSSLPQTLPAFWQLLRDQITLMETTLTAVLTGQLGDWQSWLFIYLLICLTVRMAPFPGHVRGSLGAIAAVGLITALLGMLTTRTHDVIQSGWNILSLSVATLMLLLVASLIIRGVVSLARLAFSGDGKPAGQPRRR